MYPDYKDIRSRISDPPTWFDTNGVPRYGPYKPCSENIYADESALFEIACQGCDRRALIGMDISLLSWVNGQFMRDVYQRPSATDPGSLGFGDFPRMLGPDGDDCCSGVTMTTGVTRIVEFWTRSHMHEWTRHPELEFSYEGDNRHPADDAGRGVGQTGDGVTP